MASSKVATPAGSGKGKAEVNPGIFKTYVIQPALVFHFLSSIMVFMVLQDFVMGKTCRVNLGYSDEVCDALTSKSSDATKYVEEEQVIQKYLGNVMMWRTVCENIFPIFLVILIGSWSDKYGRKIPLLAVVFAFILQHICLIFLTYSKSSGAWPVAFVSSVIPGLSGNMASFCMATFSYVADTTPVELRTVRTGITHSMLVFGMTLGLGFGGFLATTSLGFTKIFVLGLVLEVIVFLYIYIRVENVVRDPDAIKGKTVADMTSDLFSFQLFKDAFASVLEKREGDTRKKLILLLLTHFCVMAVMMGEMGVLYLFGRYKFDWDGGDIGAFMTIKTVLGFLGNFITMGVLSQRLKLSDPAVGICACLSVISASLLAAVAPSTFIMYLSPILGILGGANMIVPRAIMSKFMPAEELGKVNSFLGCLESIAPLVAAPLFTVVYTHTFEFLPGAVFLLSAALTLPPLLVYRWFLSLEQKETKKD